MTQLTSGLSKKIKKAANIIEKALKNWECGVACSFGKDSIALLHLVWQKRPSIPVLFVDTTVKFQQTYVFAERMRSHWNLNLKTIRTEWHEEVWEHDKVACCRMLKVDPFNALISELGLDAVMVAIRRDEHPARSKAKYFDHLGSVTHIHKIEFSHWRVHPLLDWTERDVWAYVTENSLPYNPLYDQGYRSIGCEPCTRPSSDTERSGREQDKELVLDRLRKLGYF
ncbi:MAG: phosphoadenosine phosphosulfate reductase family protein [Thermoplasmata archaeon]